MSRHRLGAGVVVAGLLLGSVAAAAASGAPSLCRLRHPSDGAIDWECRRLRAGDTLESLFRERWVDVARFNRIDRRHARPGVELKAPRRPADLRGFAPVPAVYPEAARDEKFVLVDLTEQFLGAYEHGRLVFSAPITGGAPETCTPTGDFRITAAHRHHPSSLYTIEGTNVPYPMTYALRFHVSAAGVASWLHGRDMPGFPASHGCIGLYDEQMQKDFYGEPAEPILDDARRLWEWVLGPRATTESFQTIIGGPRVRIIGSTTASD